MTKYKPPDISVVILSHNRIDELIKSLNEHCSESSNNSYELIIVDNASIDGSREVIVEYANKYPDIKYVFNDKNLGVAGGQNSGYLLARGDFILSIDEDAHIKPDDIVGLKNLLTTTPEAGILSPMILHEKTGDKQNPYGNTICEIGNFHGACYMLRRSLLDEIGYLDDLCMFGGEELDYSIRSRAHGYSVLYIPSIQVRHNNYQRTGTVGNERIINWLYNFVRIYYKYFPITIATLFAIRYTSSYMYYCIISKKILVFIKLYFILLIAVKDGFKHRDVIPNSVTEFYANPLTRPDIGNVPLWHKINRIIRKSNIYN